MDKTKNNPQFHLGHDWFSPAIKKDGSVESSLVEVQKNLNSKLQFVKKLSHCLCKLSDSDFDSVTDLWNRTRILKQTLEVRLGVLNPERPSAWFRESLYDSAGPFQARTLKDPVFTDYDAKLYPKVREQIQKCWRSSLELDDRYVSPGDSLWRKLLSYNQRFSKITTIEIKPNLVLHLDKVPHELHEDLDSPLLRQYLLNVAARLSKLRSELNESYSMLWRSSTQLWRQQMDEFHSSAREEGPRHKFRARRDQKYGMSKKEMARYRALQFMGFDTMPSASDLRSKYIQLAKKFHPDLMGGSEEKFKKLSESYRVLTTD